jgi:hypothetical protein
MAGQLSPAIPHNGAATERTTMILHLNYAIECPYQKIKAAMKYIEAELPDHTFNHSMRVFYYGNSPSNLLLP